MLDKEKGYIYLKSFLWYTYARLPKDKQPELVQILANHLSPQDKENIMKTIADTYRDEGIRIGKAIREAREEAIGATIWR